MLRPAISRIAVVLGVAVVGAPLATAALAADIYPPSVIVFSQKPKAGDVSITYANLPQKGTLAIFESDAKGRLSKTRVGKVALDGGDHRNIRVKLSQKPGEGGKLVAVLEQPNGNPFKNQRSNADRSFKVL
jgi:orotate phosphoribosyltransferase-like protein